MKKVEIILFLLLVTGIGVFVVLKPKNHKEINNSQGGKEMENVDLSNTKVILVVPQQDFRDEELFIPKEYLTKLGVEVLVASQDLGEAKGMLGKSIFPDLTIPEIDVKTTDAIVLIGGTGSSIFWDDELVHEIIRESLSENDIIAAICLAPVTLARAGVLNNKKATVSKSEAKKIKSAGAKYTEEEVTRDGNIITASGPSASQKFAEEIAKALTEK